MHKVTCVMRIDGIATDVIWYEGDDLAKALASMACAATRDDDPRSQTVSVLLVLGTE